MMKCVVVLGMHNGCTSLVAKGIQETGDCPMFLRSRNKNWEDVDIKRINDQILDAAGGDYKHPPSVAAIEAICNDWVWTLKTMVETRRQRAEEHQYTAWGFKDPRTTLTWPIWRRAITGHDLILVAPCRDPEAVSPGATRRWGKTKVFWQNLAETYNSRVLQILKESRDEDH